MAISYYTGAYTGAQIDAGIAAAFAAAPQATMTTALAGKTDKATTKTTWIGTRAQYEALQTDDYDLYCVTEGGFFMIANGIGLTADSYQSMYVHGGAEIAEAYGGLNYSDPIFYKTQTMTGSTPFVFDSYPGHLTGYTIFGNSVQNGTPTPDNPVEVQCVGDLVTTGEHAGEYVIPITCGGVTQNIYLSEPLRKIGGYADEIDFESGLVRRKIDFHVFDGSESIGGSFFSASFSYALPKSAVFDGNKIIVISNMYVAMKYQESWSSYDYGVSLVSNAVVVFKDIRFPSDSYVNEFKQFLSDCYSDGNPLIVYYILLTPTTESITLPQIATINGQNTLSIGTTLQPSSMSITGHIKPVTS